MRESIPSAAIVNELISSNSHGIGYNSSCDKLHSTLFEQSIESKKVAQLDAPCGSHANGLG